MEDKLCINNFGDDDVLLFGNAMFKGCKLKEEVKKLFSEYNLGQQISNSFSYQGINIDIYSYRPGIKKPYQESYQDYEKWFGNGVNCEILKLGATGWPKGKVRITFNVTLEFCPYQPEVAETSASNQPEISLPESPLDDIRRMINQESQQ